MPHSILNDLAYLEGQEAGYNKELDCDNPYPIGSDEAMSWEDGRVSVFCDDSLIPLNFEDE